MARRKTLVAGEAPGEAAAGFPPRWLLLLLGVLLCAGVVVAVAGGAAGEVFGTCIYAVFVVPTVVAAGMLGLRLTEPFARRGLFGAAPCPDGFRLVMALGLGLGALALGTLLLGTLHLIEPGGSPWALMVVPAGGMIAGFGATRRFAAGVDRGVLKGRAHRGEWLMLLAAVPVGVLVIAATFPPGTLWRSEFRGYDVMEYHLELPREYALNNSTAPVAHNVYSSLPANVEMLYLLQMELAQGVMGAERDTGYLWGAYPAQFLHALFVLLTAATLALMPLGRSPPQAGGTATVGNWYGATARAVAVLLFLGVPWTLVTGSLAYNDMGMIFFGTLALATALDAGGAGGGTGDEKVGGLRARGVLVGILLGLSVGCKMTAGVFFALPVAAIFLVRAVTDGRILRALVAAALVAGGVYAPWALRAAIHSGGNPVFPLATSILPRDGWSPEQSARFDRGHGVPAGESSPGARLAALGNDSVLDNQWSLQPLHVLSLLLAGNESPATSPAAAPEPWWNRFGWLWLALPLALVGVLITPSRRGDAGMLLLVQLVQLGGWMLATHLQSRFLLPIAVPLALLAGCGVQGSPAAREAIPVAGLRIITGTLVALHALATALILSAETSLLGGVLLPPHHPPPGEPPIGQLFRSVINMAAVVEDPAGTATVAPQKVMLIGSATAWQYVGEVDYFTTFDSHPLLTLLGDPGRALAWLRAAHVRYVVVDWTEVERLRGTYGFDPAVTREAIGALEKAGARGVLLPGLPSIQVLRIDP
jgi:hypothetical protein